MCGGSSTTQSWEECPMQLSALTSSTNCFFFAFHLQLHLLTDHLRFLFASFFFRNQVGVFNGTVKIVPSLQAPGFCNAETVDTLVHFNDVSAYSHLEMKLRTTTPFYGFKFSFAANTLDPQFKSFKVWFLRKALQTSSLLCSFLSRPISM